jgi:hypothetical protein
MKVSATGCRSPGRTPQRGRGAGAHDAVAGQRHWVDRVADRVGRLQQLAGGGLGDHRAVRRGSGWPVDLAGHDVLGELEVRRAGLLGLGDLEGLADDLGHDVRTRDPRVPLRDRAEQLDQVHELVGLLVHALEVGLAGRARRAARGRGRRRRSR